MLAYAGSTLAMQCRPESGLKLEKLSNVWTFTHYSLAKRQELYISTRNEMPDREHFRQPVGQVQFKGTSMEDQTDTTELAVLTADIVSAYVGNNVVQASELPQLIQSVYGAISSAVEGEKEEPKEELKPAVPVRRSVTPDYIICLEDGKKFKSLKRHLRTAFNLTPEQYREKWGLKPDYPMVAPNYATVRSEMAKRIGLGRKRAAS